MTHPGFRLGGCPTMMDRGILRYEKQKQENDSPSYRYTYNDLHVHRGVGVEARVHSSFSSCRFMHNAFFATIWTRTTGTHHTLMFRKLYFVCLDRYHL